MYAKLTYIAVTGLLGLMLFLSPAYANYDCAIRLNGKGKLTVTVKHGKFGKLSAKVMKNSVRYGGKWNIKPNGKITRPDGRTVGRLSGCKYQKLKDLVGG